MDAAQGAPEGVPARRRVGAGVARLRDAQGTEWTRRGGVEDARQGGGRPGVLWESSGGARRALSTAILRRERVPAGCGATGEGAAR